MSDAITPEWPLMTAGSWRDTHRLILATYVDRTEPYLAALVAPGSDSAEADIAALVELSAATNSRLAAQADLSQLNVSAYELVYDLDYSTFINAAFAYPGLGGRFHDDTRGAWYASMAVETSLAGVAQHKTRHLAEIGVFEDYSEYQDFMCDIGGDHFADLRDGDERSLACLDPDSYVASRALATQLLRAGAAGVVWPSVRHPGGTSVVCFRPALLPPVRRGQRWRLTWAGTPVPTVEALP